MENIEDKVVVITGASSGMGAATARKLARLGAKVVLGARREERLKGLVEEFGGNALYVKTDVSKKADVDNLIFQAIAAFGKIDVLWNNAGVMPVSFFDEGKLEEWERMIDINIKGVLYGIHSVLPHMLEKGSGHIITTGSTAGLKTHVASGVYSGTKFAVGAIMETLREELAGKIKVTIINPGAVATELGHDITSAKVFEMFGGLMDLPKLNADSIADAVIYAISQPGNIGVNEITIRPLEQAL
jgi:NADP-dependent 3-hydroxy acid dehydrogenase YdfG